jgi:hypothetical protein
MGNSLTAKTKYSIQLSKNSITYSQGNPDEEITFTRTDTELSMKMGVTLDSPTVTLEKNGFKYQTPLGEFYFKDSDVTLLADDMNFKITDEYGEPEKVKIKSGKTTLKINKDNPFKITTPNHVFKRKDGVYCQDDVCIPLLENFKHLSINNGEVKSDGALLHKFPHSNEMKGDGTTTYKFHPS